MNDTIKHNNPHDDVLVEDEILLKTPPMYKVLLHNDDYTPMDFVVHILQNFFSHDLEKATKIMLLVHNTGVGICGTYTKEIAETKVHQVNNFSKDNGHPLKCSMKKI